MNQYMFLSKVITDSRVLPLLRHFIQQDCKHESLYEELQTRLTEWNSQQCIGDCFIRLQSNLKAYTNFHNNYPIILATIDKCREQDPSFRAFLKRHSRTEETRMLTPQELFLMISRRIKDYIRLLVFQEHCTPTDHPDRAHLASAIKGFKDLQVKIDQIRKLGDLFVTPDTRKKTNQS